MPMPNWEGKAGTLHLQHSHHASRPRVCTATVQPLPRITGTHLSRRGCPPRRPSPWPAASFRYRVAPPAARPAGAREAGQQGQIKHQTSAAATSKPRHAASARARTFSCSSSRPAHVSEADAPPCPRHTPEHNVHAMHVCTPLPSACTGLTRTGCAPMARYRSSPSRMSSTW